MFNDNRIHLLLLLLQTQNLGFYLLKQLTSIFYIFATFIIVCLFILLRFIENRENRGTAKDFMFIDIILHELVFAQVTFLILPDVQFQLI